MLSQSVIKFSILTIWPQTSEKIKIFKIYLIYNIFAVENLPNFCPIPQSFFSTSTKWENFAVIDDISRQYQGDNSNVVKIQKTSSFYTSKSRSYFNFIRNVDMSISLLRNVWHQENLKIWFLEGQVIPRVGERKISICPFYSSHVCKLT